MKVTMFDMAKTLKLAGVEPTYDTEKGGVFEINGSGSTSAEIALRYMTVLFDAIPVVKEGGNDKT